MQSGYREDLAHVHDTAFGGLAEAGAGELLERLRRAGFSAGTVVELGCGGGHSSRRLVDAGFDVVGIDLSPALIDRARRRVPEGDFRVAPIAGVDLPPCVAVTAFGEVLNYRFDPADGRGAGRQLFERVHRALAPGGLFLFDLATRDRAPAGGSPRTFFEGEDWTVLVETSTDRDTRLMTRRITTFRRHQDAWRRECEEHRLDLADPADVIDALRRAGFSVQVPRAYGVHRLPPGLVVFAATR